VQTIKWFDSAMPHQIRKVFMKHICRSQKETHEKIKELGYPVKVSSCYSIGGAIPLTLVNDLEAMLGVDSMFKSSMTNEVAVESV